MAQQCIDEYHESLINALEDLYKTNETIALQPFAEPSASEGALVTSPQPLGIISIY